MNNIEVLKYSASQVSRALKLADLSSYRDALKLNKGNKNGAHVGARHDWDTAKVGKLLRAYWPKTDLANGYTKINGSGVWRFCYNSSSQMWLQNMVTGEQRALKNGQL